MLHSVKHPLAAAAAALNKTTMKTAAAAAAAAAGAAAAGAAAGAPDQHNGVFTCGQQLTPAACLKTNTDTR